MRPEVKRWFKIVFCTLMVVFSVSIGFSDWVYPDDSGDKTTGDGTPTQSEVKPCAYIDSNKSVLYTIEDALAKATEKSKKGTTAVSVFVKPGTETVIGSCTITKNVTLTLPYSNETYNEKEFMNIVKDANGDDQVINDFADKNPTLYRKISVKIKSDACLTIDNGARFNIGGQNGGTSPQGATTGLYAEVFLQNGASISCSGTIDCFGFIKEESKGGASIVMENQGILYQPLCIYDWGSATTVYKKQGDGLFPFNRFDCPNVRPSITFKKGSIFNCFVHVYGSTAGHFTTNANIISDNDNSFLVLTEASSSISWHFTDKSDLNATSTSDSNHLTEINTYSNVNLSKIQVTLNAPVVGEMNIDSSNYYLPVYYGYSIKASSGTLLIKYRTKFLPGSKFYVANGATATFSQNAVFYQSNKGQDGNTIPSYGNSTPALLSNSGIVNVNAGFEGKIVVGDGIVDSSLTKVNVASSYSAINDCMEGVFNGNVITGKVTKYGPFSFGGAKGLIAASKTSNDPIDMCFAKKCTYLSNVSHWYYDSISIDSCLSIKEDPKVSIKETKDWFGNVTGGTFTVGLNLVVTSFDTRVINIDSAECVWNVPTSMDGLKKIKKTESNNGYTCSITGEISSSGDFTLPVSANVTLNDGLSSVANYNISIKAKGCLIYDSLLLMADGTYKKAGELMPGDRVLSFNHETGKIEPTAVIVNDDVDREATNYNVINLHFSDGTKTSIVSEHGFFDLDLNKYVYIREDNYSQYIGHSFYGINGNGDLSSKKVKLLSVDVEEKFTKICSPVTANNLNIISDNMLSMAGGIEGLFNFFDYDPVTLKYDEAKKQADIEKYGLLTYEDYKDLLPYEVYEVLPCQYMSVSIGKGLITWDKIKEYINHWSDQLIQ